MKVGMMSMKNYIELRETVGRFLLKKRCKPVYVFFLLSRGELIGKCANFVNEPDVKKYLNIRHVMENRYSLYHGRGCS